MKNRLILVEGIPGSGKSTIANRIKEYLESKGVKAKLFNEGDAHPADMAWNAYVPEEEYKMLLINNPEHEEIIKRYTTIEDGYAIVAYTKLGIDPYENKIMEYFENHEIYDGRVSLDIFKKLIFSRWRSFAENVDQDSVFIFECAYLQNNANELMGANSKDVYFITDYMVNLIQTAEKLNPKLIYLTQPSTYETISRVAKERVSPDKSKVKDWIDLVINYVENSAYGKKHNLKGFDGAIKFFDDRKKIELSVIDKLPIDKVVIDNPRYHWEEVVNKVIESLE